jgi:hypothetical protein
MLANEMNACGHGTELNTPGIAVKICRKDIKIFICPKSLLPFFMPVSDFEQIKNSKIPIDTTTVNAMSQRRALMKLDPPGQDSHVSPTRT